ncbi:MAG: 4Fe-4S dicluster domain-containing protein [Chloroflexi bacterium]|nr:4Fe-4S dicluster domain-containing protein [Chloroflexota bacterium]
MVQYGFFFDQSRCTDCRACVLACRNWHDIPPGPVKWCRMFQWEKGVYPNVRLHFLFAPCYHCEDPVCVRACQNRAIYKEDKYGAVLVDPQKCRGDRRCWSACPYGAPQFQSDQPGTTMSKCTMCPDRLEQGRGPICVESCPTRALDFGPLPDLMSKYGKLRILEDLPRDTITRPAIVFKARLPRKKLVCYDENKALELLKNRDAFERLPPLYLSGDDVISIPPGLVGRDALNLKPRTAEEAQGATQHDE